MPHNSESVSSSSDCTSEHTDDDSSSVSTLCRRTALRAGAVGLSGVALIGASGSASAKEFVNGSDISGTEYSVPSDTRLRILVGDNEYGTYGDLTDCLIETNGENVDIVAFGSDWTIRNVGIDGQVSGDNPLIDVRVDDPGETCVIENVYLGDGGDTAPGIFVKRYDHKGTVKIQDVYVSGFSDNGIYASAPSKSGGGDGDTQIENCAAINNNTANFRISGSDSYIRDSVSVATDVPPNIDGTKTCRGVWARRSDGIEVTNTDILTTDGETSAIWATGGGSVNYTDSDYRTTYPYGDFEGDVDTSDIGNDPDTSVPSGVPTSASEAAGGGLSDGSSSSEESESTEQSADSDDEEDEDEDEETADSSDEADDEANQMADDDTSGLPNSVTIRTTGDEVRYKFEVEGDIEAAESGDRVSGSQAAGLVISGEDEYEFSGEFVEFRYSGPIEISVNDQLAYQDG